ncbi:hypothetical protein [Pseudosulfitobacter sp. DSM 107133]|uniref:hypothetical protein n=1 Tax=Pseudosulfitobacter sp. DSM 107133 TaxID=2883100 RepID=UPI000DF44EE0|nr:hypothetical protein [Pseudosulfitobacter sp. DSM 107133]UOA29030.1 hypothetical protein DSM107133_03789 [Pseudosulfitobacter sp. DSM 107133]
MKFGVLHFSYSRFGHFEREYAATGKFSVNLGDYMQTLAVRRLYSRLGIDDAQIVPIDRETLSTYDGPPVFLPMNACFYHWCFPLPPAITPIWIGFQARKELIVKHSDFFRTQGAIGCRDSATAAHFTALGIDNFISGCLTLSLPPRAAAPDAATARILCIHGTNAGRLPGTLLPAIPKDMLERIEFVSQRRDMTHFPLTPEDCADLEALTTALLQHYMDTAERIITPLHHATTPCLASGIPVVLCRAEADDRFSWLKDLMPVYVAPDFDQIDWSAPLVDISEIRNAQIDRFASLLEAARQQAENAGQSG